MTIEQIINIVNGDVLNATKIPKNVSINHITIDSRQTVPTEKIITLFIAIEGIRYDGHKFINQMVKVGVKFFLVNKNNSYVHKIIDSKANIGTLIQVNDTISALQKIAATHRKTFTYPVVGITGSNGKTIVKEWLGQLLYNHKKVVKSPKSYNSQIGVPLSIMGMKKQHQVAIIEAGVSMPNEMKRLEKIIKPTIGIFSNIGSAHDNTFSNKKEKINEKKQLFKNTKKVFYNSDNQLLFNTLHDNKKYIGIGVNDNGQEIYGTLDINKKNKNATLTIKSNAHNHNFVINQYDNISIKNLLLCIVAALELGCKKETLQQNLSKLSAVSMRMEIKNGVNNCYLIDDSYSNDYVGLEHALRFLSQQKQRNDKSIIISDVLQDARKKQILYKDIGDLLSSYELKNIVCIGKDISKFKKLIPKNANFYISTDEYLKSNHYKAFNNEIILIKGSRKQYFEKIIQEIEYKKHATRLYINLDNLTNNYMYFKSKLKPNVKMLVMIKALAYGSGSLEVANHLQNLGADYFGVAFSDEGIMLRQNGIKAPILVMNAYYDNYSNLFEYDLEPEIFSLNMLNELSDIAEQKRQNLNIHIKIETGMNRLGIDANSINELIEILKTSNYLKVVSVFTHQASAELCEYDLYNHLQVKILDDCYRKITIMLNIKPLRHILKTSGILRFPEYQKDMVRLGIGLHGYTYDGDINKQLVPVATLKTHISFIKTVTKGQAIGYNRREVLDKNSLIATLPIGYADGLDRRLSNKVGNVIINGKKAPILGNICMDMCMVDVSGIDCKVNDEVVIFGIEQPLPIICDAIGTVPYEILCSVGNRVKRVYYSEN